MKPTIVCKNFDPPENLLQFMKESIGEILKISPYDSYLEAHISKEVSEYSMTISINYPEGKFSSTARHADLMRTITDSTADIFTQVRTWWKSRFPVAEHEKTDWAGNFNKSDAGQIFQITKPDIKPDIQNYGGTGHLDVEKKGLRVLLVDDDLESVTPLELCLQKLGCSVFIANNGFEAIHELVSGDRNYDVIILDWQMPGITGGQALLNAQKVISYDPTVIQHWTHKKIPVITFSSKSREEIDVPKCQDFDHIDHWEKPSSYLQLLNQATETLAKLGGDAA